MSLWPWLVGTAGGFAAGWMARRRSGGAVGISGRKGTVLPGPAVRWLREAHGALGVWAVGDQEAVLPEAALDPELSHAEAERIQAKLKLFTPGSSAGVERGEATVLVTELLGERVAAMLLESSWATPERIDRAREDLQALLEAMTYRRLADEMGHDPLHPGVTAGTVALALTSELEHQFGADVLLAVPVPAGAVILGVSPRADRRLLNITIDGSSPLGSAANGGAVDLRTHADPTGHAAPDRRLRGEQWVLLGLDYRGERIAAVALGLRSEGSSVATVREAAQPALRLSVPRLVAALAADEIRSISITDPLTGLHNRRGLDAELGRMGGSGGVLVACDLDRFKKLNDTLGHAAGDAALVHFAGILKELVRGSDCAARVGGEEFHIWAPGASISRGAEIAERIRAALEHGGWKWENTPWPLTASFGVAGVPETSSSIHNLAVQADAALYVAKERGRNRVEIAPGG